MTHITLQTSGAGWNWYIYHIDYTTEDYSVDPPNSDDTDDLVAPPPNKSPVDSSDSRFIKALPYDDFKATTFRSGGPIRLDVPITRVVGEVNDDGSLKDPDKLVSNHVIAPNVDLVLAYYDVDASEGEKDWIRVNGVELQQNGTRVYLPGQDKQWTYISFPVRVNLIHFAKPVPGDDPIAGQNVIEIEIDEDSAGTGCDCWAMSVAWADLHVNALYPVVMVHGNNSCGDFFAGKYSTPCDENKRFPENEWFITPFKEQGILFNNSINMETDKVEIHANYLRSELPQIAREYGVKHLHLVAHSKGGLDLRKFLADTPSGSLSESANLGILSLITLSTPHAGTVGANYQEDGKQIKWWDLPVGQDSTIRAIIAKFMGSDKGKHDLRVDTSRTFNDQNIKRLPSYFIVDGKKDLMSYVGYGAEANLDDSLDDEGPTIQVSNLQGEDETRGLPDIKIRKYIPWVGAWSRNKALTMVYRMLWNISDTKVIPFRQGGIKLHRRIVDIPYEDGVGRVNDLAVTKESAIYAPLYDSFGKYAKTYWVRNNHATIATREVADQVIQVLKAIQPIQ